MCVRTRLGEEFKTDSLYLHQGSNLGMYGDLHSDQGAARTSYYNRRDAAMYCWLPLNNPSPYRTFVLLAEDIINI